MVSPNLKLLLWFMQEGNGCPPPDLLQKTNNRFLKLALNNKSAIFLFHLLECPVCKRTADNQLKKELKKYYLRSLVAPVVESKEKKKIVNFFQKNNISFVFIKDLSFYKKLKIYQRFKPGFDLDLLVPLRDCEKFIDYCLSNDYRIQKNLILKNKRKDIYYEEHHLVNDLKMVTIDLHTLVAIPHDDEFNFLNSVKITQISQWLLKESRISKKGALSNELFLFSLIVHYLGSDILKGLRSLYDINLYIKEYQNDINWYKFFSLCQQYEIYYSTIFIFLLGQRLFGLNSIPILSSKIPWRVKYLADHFPVEKIAIFPEINTWKKNKKAKEMFLENLLIKILLGDKTTRLRIIRPKILKFLFSISFDRQE